MAEKIIAVRVEVTGLSEESRQIEQLNAELEKLAVERKRYNDETKKGKGVTEEQRAALAKLSQNTRDLTEEKKRLLKTETDSTRVFKAAEGSMEELRAKTAKLKEETNRLNLSTTEGKKRFQENTAQIQANTTKIRDFDRSLSGSSTLVGEYGLGIKKAFMAIGAAIAASYGAVKAFKGIIESTDITADAFEQAMGGAREALHTFMRAVATADFSNFFSNMAKSIELGIEYEKVLDEIQDRERAGQMLTADEIYHSKELELIWRDRTKSATERKDAEIEWQELQEKGINRAAKIAEDRYNNDLKTVAGIRMTVKALEEMMKAYEANKAELDEAEKNVKRYNNLVVQVQSPGGGGLMGGGGQVTTSDLTKAKAFYAALTETQKKWFDEYQKMGLVGEKDRELLAKSYTNMKTAQGALLDPQLATIRASASIATQFDKEAKAGDVLADSLAKINAELRRELSQFFGFKEERAITPKRVEGIIKQVAPGLTPTQGIRPGGVGFPDVDAALLQDKELEDERKKAIKRIEDLSIQSVDAIFSYKKSVLDRQMAAELAGAAGNEKKTLEIKQRYARQNQKIAISEAIIMGALGIIRAFKDYMYPFSLAIAALTAISTGVQIAAIKNQKFAGGGRIRGGHRITPDATGDDTLIVARQGEVVLNDRHQRALGGAATFKRIGVPGFAESGLVGASNLSYQPNINIDMNQLGRIISQTVNTQRVQLVLSDLEDAQNKLDIIKSPSKF